MVKYIFLDIDGVLNHQRWYEYYWENKLQHTDTDYDIDFRAVERINCLVEETGAEIVISSSWRLDMDNTVSRLKHAGLKCTPTKRIEGCEFGDNSPIRGELIADFLHDNPCDNYVIIDDDGDMTDEQKNGHFVQTSEWTGFDEDKFIEALKVLTQKC